MSEKTPQPKSTKKTTKKVTKKTTKKTTKKVAKKTVKKTAKKTTKKVVKKVVKKTTKKRARKSVVTEAPTRKAPTALAEERAFSRMTKHAMYAGLAVFVCMLGASVAIGFSDSGEIDVSAAIEERKRKADEKELRRIEQMAAGQAKEVVPFGGLVSSNEPAPPKRNLLAEAKFGTASSTASTTATTTDDVATSTEELVVEETATTTEEVIEETPDPEPSEDTSDTETATTTTETTN